MARLEDKGKRGLPPPPAPPRRSANPWKYSATARKREAEPAPTPVQDLLEGIVVADEPQAPARAPAHAGAPSQAPPERAHRVTEKRGAGVWPLFVLLIAIGIVVKVVSEGFEGRDWRQMVAPLIAIAFIAHGWWRLRQRRRDKSGQADDDED